jgi:hypothetical protein
VEESRVIDSLPTYECLVVPCTVQAGRIHAIDQEACTVTLFDPVTTVDPVTIIVERGWFKPRRTPGRLIAPEMGGYAVFAGKQWSYCPKADFEHGYVLKETP